LRGIHAPFAWIGVEKEPFSSLFLPGEKTPMLNDTTDMTRTRNAERRSTDKERAR